MQEDDDTPTHIWCDDCGCIVGLRVQEDAYLDISGKFNGRDMVCHNGHIIATVFEVAND